MDWKDALQQIKSEGNLPEGEDIPQAPEPEAKKPALRIVIDKKQRRGKTATIIEGFGDDDAEAERVAKLLKTRLGCGGSSRGGEILLQGERKEQAAALLADLGYKCK